MNERNFFCKCAECNEETKRKKKIRIFFLKLWKKKQKNKINKERIKSFGYFFFIKSLTEYIWFFRMHKKNDRSFNGVKILTKKCSTRNYFLNLKVYIIFTLKLFM